MRRHIRYLAGSALGLLMAGSGASAQTQGLSSFAQPAAGTFMAQADTANPEELPRKKRQKPPAESEAPAAEQAAPGGEPQAQPESRSKPKKRQKQATEPEAPAAGPEAAPAGEPQAEPEAQPSMKKRQKAAEPEAPAAEPEAAPADEPQAGPEDQPKPKKRQKQAAEPEAPAAEPEAAPAAGPEAAPAGEPQAGPEDQPKPKKRQKQAEQPSTEQEAAPSPDQPGMAEPDGPKRKKAPGDENPAQTGEPPADGTVPADSGTAGDGSSAPVFDSAKEAPGAPARKPKGGKTGKGEAAPAEPMAPPPADDRAAQEKAGPANIRPVTEEAGQRVAEPPQFERRRPKGVGIVKEDGDRVVVEIDNQPFVESSDRRRLGRGANDVYYEDLPQGRSRETVVRADGTRVVTIRNAYGDIVRRSRITPDGREYVLVYVDDRDAARLDDWRDPGLDLPPMRLDVPESDYILDADNVEDPEVYYDFLERPPVERVERLYSVDEVKRSARIRDKVPRIELDTLTFEFGSASIAESEVPKLEGVAQAIGKVLKRNPAETFLIEGHTDAVGTDVANLALSDRRAEAVAEALTSVFEIPPENLATQGYGERYLKVRTEEPEQVNRRVVIRRITPLVAPVASAN